MKRPHPILAAALAALFFSAAFIPQASAENQRVRVRGSVIELKGQTLSVKTREGPSVDVALGDGWGVSGLQRASMADIKPGDFVGIASLPREAGGDGALEVLIFPASMKGTGEGSRPWDLKPNSTMTNATVAKAVKAVDGHSITLTYQGKEKTISITDDTPIVTFTPAGKADLTPGARVIVMGKKATDGTISAPMFRGSDDAGLNFVPAATPAGLIDPAALAGYSFDSSIWSLKPGASVGTMNAESPFLPSSGSVTAKTIATAARLPLVTNCFEPFSTQRPSFSTARVRRLFASLPACGSVRQKQA